MKGFKKSLAFCVVLCLMFVCLTGCMNIDMGVEIKDDGTATLSSKLMIEEDAYNALLSFEGSEGFGGTDVEDVEPTESTEATDSSDDALDLKSFQKEVIGDEVFYTYEKSMDVTSYDELETMLITDGDNEGVDLFSDVEIVNDTNLYSFQATTTAMEDDETPVGSSDWLSLTLTVTLPGKIVETSGEQIDDNTVKFVLDDFTDSHTLSVSSEVAVLGMREIFLCAAIVAVLVGTIAYLVIRKKKGHRF